MTMNGFCSRGLRPKPSVWGTGVGAKGLVAKTSKAAKSACVAAITARDENTLASVHGSAGPGASCSSLERMGLQGDFQSVHSSNAFGRQGLGDQ